MEKIKSKKLHRSALALLTKMQDTHRKWEHGNLQFIAQEPETRQDFYTAIDAMKRFIDNIK